MPDALPPRSPTLLDDADTAALVGFYAAASKAAALRDIGLSPLCLVAAAGARTECSYKDRLWAPIP